MNRLYNLDYLRGLTASGIMIYHYLSWSLSKFPAESFMGRLGVYGVAVFYVLSGLTLFHVYFNKMAPSTAEIGSFFKKRALRIFPLLWLVTILAVLLAGRMPDFTALFLNLSGLFGFIAWDTSFSAGVWSIGNELVFYVFFPVFVLFTKKYRWLMLLLCLLLLSWFCYFAFVKLDPGTTLTEQWKIYSNPLNQVFLFAGGFLIGLFLQPVNFKKPVLVSIGLAGLLVFIFYPVSGDTIHLVTGINRLLFSACCFAICISFYKLGLQLPGFLHKSLSMLGEASYSVYLLHPIVWTLTGIATELISTHFFYFPQSGRLLISLLLTLVSSYYVYQYFERYFMKLGKTPDTRLPPPSV